jgi:hypothetical protein
MSKEVIYKCHICDELADEDFLCEYCDEHYCEDCTAVSTYMNWIDSNMCSSCQFNTMNDDRDE